MQNRYLLLFLFIVFVYRIKQTQPKLFVLLERMGPILYPGPVIQNIELIFKDALAQFSV